VKSITIPRETKQGAQENKKLHVHVTYYAVTTTSVAWPASTAKDAGEKGKEL